MAAATGNCKSYLFMMANKASFHGIHCLDMAKNIQESEQIIGCRPQDIPCWRKGLQLATMSCGYLRLAVDSLSASTRVGQPGPKDEVIRSGAHVYLVALTERLTSIAKAKD